MPDGESSSESGEFVAAEGGSAGGPSLSSSTPADQTGRLEVRLTPDVWDGVCLAHSWQNGGRAGYGTEESAETLDHLRALDVDWISLTPFSWMESQQAASIRGEHNDSIPEGAESRSRIKRVVDQARARGMHTVLKPHIWIRGGAYRGDIEPRDSDGDLAWDQWWDSYEAYILYYARQAEAFDIPVFFVGVELGSALTARPGRFLSVIESVRDVYGGDLVYAANWDETQPDRLWKALDYVGVQFYPPLTPEPEPTAEELAEAVEQRLRPWVRLSRRVDREFILSEVGFRAASNAAKAPHHWPENADEDGKRVDKDLQRRAYTALFSALGEVEELRGVFLWKYFTDPDTHERHPYGFSPRGYPAEEVLRRAYTDEPAQPSKGN